MRKWKRKKLKKARVNGMNVSNGKTRENGTPPPENETSFENWTPSDNGAPPENEIPSEDGDKTRENVTPPENERYMTAEECADYLKIALQTLYTYIRKYPDFPYEILTFEDRKNPKWRTRKYRFDREKIDAFKIPKPEKNADIMTLTECANFLNVSINTLYRYMNKYPDFPYERKGRFYIFSKEAISEYKFPKHPRERKLESYLTEKELEAVLKMSKEKFTECISRKDFPRLQIGKVTRYDLEEVKTYLGKELDNIGEEILVSKAELGEIFKVSQETLDRYLSREDFPCEMVGPRYSYDLSKVKEYFRTKGAGGDGEREQE